MVTPFAQAQFNTTQDRKSLLPSLGVGCFDCHVNGHTSSATHTVGDIRPDNYRHRIDTPSLRGVNIQRLFGSQRALKSVEDFTEFEQRAAYFDGDPAKATPQELHGQMVFFGKGRCGECHPAPYYTDNTMHNLMAERFYKAQPVEGLMAGADGPIKTFPLRGIKESPPYLHDDRLLTLDATEKSDLVAFMKTL